MNICSLTERIMFLSDFDADISYLNFELLRYFGLKSVFGIEHSDKDIMINDTTLRFGTCCSVKEEGTDIAVYYSGIRDYSHLFYWVEEDGLRERLGEFYEEADKAFDNASWLSFALLCGAVFEGVLYAKGYRNGLEAKINKAVSDSIIDNRTSEIMHKVREFRNLIHAYKYEEPRVTRRDAMDIRSVLDKLLISF